MTSDIDALMVARKLDAILVVGNAEQNPPMTYLVGGGSVHGAILVKKQGQEPVIFCIDMEREEAARSGLRVRRFGEFPWAELLREAGGNPSLAAALRLERILTSMQIGSGRVGLYGQAELGNWFAVLDRFQDRMPQVTLVGEAPEESLFMRAMETKSHDEVMHIRRMGQITTEVVGLTAAVLTGCRVREDEVLLRGDGEPLTIGDVKARIRLWLGERDAELPEGFIFAIGRDAGVPHSQGDPADLIRLGRTIVFDIFPAGPHGYFYDFTRTWSLGYAAPEAQKIYDDVKAVYDQVMENIDLNASFRDYQRLACEEFEKRGHKSPLNTPAPLDGYVHSLGHGVGLNIHELPSSGQTATDDSLLKPGVVITIEPGLYYPEQDMGVRIEDTYWVRPDGRVEMLAAYPYDFVLPMKP